MTYKAIATIHKRRFDATLKTCWIADVKRQMGLPVKVAHNRVGTNIINPCPAKYVETIRQIINGNIS